jgi:PPOX class probable F420-dependent enzyme
VEISQGLEFLRDHHHAALVTRRRDGGVQVSPVVAGLLEGGWVGISTRSGLAKAQNLRRDPAISLCVVSNDWFGPWVQLDGHAEVVPLPEAMDGLIALYRVISGEHPDWDDYRAAMRQEERVLVRFQPERVSGRP